MLSSISSQSYLSTEQHVSPTVTVSLSSYQAEIQDCIKAQESYYKNSKKCLLTSLEKIYKCLSALNPKTWSRFCKMSLSFIVLEVRTVSEFHS